MRIRRVDDMLPDGPAAIKPAIARRRASVEIRDMFERCFLLVMIDAQAAGCVSTLDDSRSPTVHFISLVSGSDSTRALLSARRCLCPTDDGSDYANR